MNKFDLIVLIPLAWGLYRGFRKGLVIEAASLISLILATWGAIKFSGYLSELLSQEYEFETEYLPIVSFFLVFIGVVILVFIAARLLEGLLKLTMLSTFNKISGAVFCCFKYALIVSVLLFITNSFSETNPFVSNELKTSSYLYTPLSELSITLIPNLKDHIIGLKESSIKSFQEEE